MQNLLRKKKSENTGRVIAYLSQELCIQREMRLTSASWKCSNASEEPPFEIENSMVYYVGPTPAKPGHPIGSAGPTTSYRMDAYAPTLLDLGQPAMIGKGQRSEAVMDAVVRNGAVYFAAIGGSGRADGKADKIGRSDSL